MRTLDEINAEYSRATLDYGDSKYKIFALEKHFQEAIAQEKLKTNQLETQLLSLNEEAAKLKDQDVSV